MIIEKEIAVSGGVIRTAKLRHEWFEFLDDPVAVVRTMRQAKATDLFTFLHDLNDKRPIYPFYKEPVGAAILPVTNYKLWWNGLAPSVRNKIRKAYKSGVEVIDAELDDNFARGVETIYNESPIRQRRKFCHYGQSAASIKEELSSLWGRYYLIGAYLKGEMIGFAKLFHGNDILRTVHIISKLSHRDKPVQDALIARAVQICEEKNIHFFQYGSWSTGGLGAFKEKRGFTMLDYWRYYVPISYRGKLALQFRLHHGLRGRLSGKWIESLVGIRTYWNNFRYGSFPTSDHLANRT